MTDSKFDKFKELDRINSKALREQEEAKKIQPSIKCNCGQSFKDDNELWEHKEYGNHKTFLKKILTIDFN